MIGLSRREFVAGLFVAPAIIKCSSLMAISPVPWKWTPPRDIVITFVDFQGRNWIDANLVSWRVVPEEKLHGILSQKMNDGFLIGDKFVAEYDMT
jgi:hypothetical protein